MQPVEQPDTSEINCWRCGHLASKHKSIAGCVGGGDCTCPVLPAMFELGPSTGTGDQATPVEAIAAVDLTPVGGLDSWDW